MSWATLDQLVVEQSLRLDSRINDILTRMTTPEQRVHCREGCGCCCSLAVNCSFPEARFIANALTPAQQTSLEKTLKGVLSISQKADDIKQFLQLYRTTVDGCALLNRDKQNCQIYDKRPLSCRALLSSRPSSWCGVDFSALHPLEKQAFLSSLDPQWVNYPTHYLAAPQELAAELENCLVIEMLKSFGLGLGGNLLYLVWLEVTENLSDLIAKHRKKAKELIDSLQQEHPFLLQASFTERMDGFRQEPAVEKQGPAV